MNFLRQTFAARRRFFAFTVAGCGLIAALAASIAFAPESFFSLKNALQLADFAGFSAGAIFVLLIGATLVSEDLTCVSAGVLAAQGRITLAAAIFSCATGILLGDVLIFLAGRYWGRRAFSWQLTRRFLSEEAVDRSSRWLEKKGMKTVFVSRFVFGARLPLYFAAGALKTSFRRFALYFSLAVAVWTPLLVGATYKIGAEAVKRSLFDQNLWLALLVSIAVVYGLFRLAQRLSTRRGRRILWGEIKRRFIWEFWSIRVFYAPVVVYVLFLALRHRGLTVFTCANPALPASGFVGESKDEILRLLAKSEAARDVLLKHLFLPKESSAAEKTQTAANFMRENDLTFPVALKPDVGERGNGVEIIFSADELGKKLSRDADLIVQEFAAGLEASVFYYRFPNEEKGRIFSITEKRFPQVVGDGARTLEELILGDARAVCLAEKYFERNRDRLETVPARGERIEIVDIGTHSRGAIFLDGERLNTPALEDKIDEICRGIDGFYFGRFDIRCASFEDLAAARNLKIVELNGVTSESTNIYDPRYALTDAYRILFRQWWLAFEIGARNRQNGFMPTKIFDLTKLVLNMQFQTPKSKIQN